MRPLWQAVFGIMRNDASVFGITQHAIGIMLKIFSETGGAG
jgi:hypothetical protein